MSLIISEENKIIKISNFYFPSRFLHASKILEHKQSVSHTSDGVQWQMHTKSAICYTKNITTY